VTGGVAAPASLPPPGLPGLDPSWSRLVTVPEIDDAGRTFHVLDNRVADPVVTLLCVHGNPSWSYLWRDLIGQAPAGVRVIAVDHLDMGYSERTATTRRLDRRIEDLGALTGRLDIEGPVVTVAHDWGGPISLGWALRHREDLAGIVLANTAVGQPAGDPAPRVIRMVRSAPVLDSVAVKTSAFVRGAIEMSRRRPSSEVRDAYLAPYSSPDRRAAVGEFVADIPLEPDHPSAPTLDAIAAGLADLGEVPALLVWGAADPVFSDLYLHDLEARLPQADVHRFARARHYVPEEVDVAEVVHRWVGRIGEQVPEPLVGDPGAPLWDGLTRRAGDAEPAVVEMTADGRGRTISFADLAADVDRVASGLHRSGLRLGDRVALLVPPGVDLTVCLYACWRMGAVTVVADAGLGLRGMGRALESAAPDYLIGVPRALAAARAVSYTHLRAHET